MACVHHACPQILAIDPDARQATPIVIFAPDHHLDLPVQRELGQRIAGSLATGLADFWRVDAVKTQLARRTATRRLNPEGVAIEDE